MVAVEEAKHRREANLKRRALEEGELRSLERDTELNNLEFEQEEEEDSVEEDEQWRIEAPGMALIRIPNIFAALRIAASAPVTLQNELLPQNVIPGFLACLLVPRNRLTT